MNWQSVNEQLRKQPWPTTVAQHALGWIKELDGKGALTFLQLDIVDFYPSISRQLFDKAIDFAQETVEINYETRKILFNAHQSLLFHDNCVCRKESAFFYLPSMLIIIMLI